MTRYYKVECPRCQGRGIIAYHLVLERECPLCCGKGLVIDYAHPVVMMPQPAMELTMVRPKMTAERLAETNPLSEKTSAALLTLRQSVRRRQRPPAELLVDPFAVDDEHAEPKSEFIEGAEPTRRDFSGRMRQR